MTFQAYHRARRMGLALREVRRGERVDDARNGSGFESASGFRDAFTRIFGEPPTAAKAQGGLFAERIETPLGAMLAIADDEGLASARVRRSTRDGARTVDPSTPASDQCRSGRTSTSRCRSFSTGRLFFRKESRVQCSAGAGWIAVSTSCLETLAFIPVGETRSYSWMARNLGDVEMRRAVGRANGDNMMCIIIPCHRVIRADGTFCGYGGGFGARNGCSITREERSAVSNETSGKVQGSKGQHSSSGGAKLSEPILSRLDVGSSAFSSW